jgi:hypothetical protein
VPLDDGTLKPKDQWCRHARKSAGCAIYATRPAACREFECSWLKGYLPQWARPDKIHGMMQVAPDGFTLFIHEDVGYPGSASRVLTPAVAAFIRLPGRVAVICCGDRRRVVRGDQQQVVELSGEAANAYIDAHLTHYAHHG